MTLFKPKKQEEKKPQQNIITDISDDEDEELNALLSGIPGLSSNKTTTTKKGGLQSWVLEVTDDITASNWKKQIAQVQNNTQLMAENTTVTFDVDDPKAGFYRYIRLMSTGQSHLGNLSMVLKNFDITGKLIISKD